ncbi:hypothetical protein [Thermococcus thioreducens]|uniref:Uncharacterized protein n=1 Tax=Thermococcus thioreducens TaxID=277988 RepID=A0A0Q2XN06_9EURY|nr:hypothetical protein [Thermococcus thioreducens]ASJ12108.1 hypothetical protein A3L14_04085 [Thermococcus thioreducens]KQH82676.1 hypothetical protein AMR53_03480 [Thermococcus thioreducens]
MPDPPTSACLSGVPLEGHLEVYPEWVEAGDSVSVHITVTNLDLNCAQGPFDIELVDDSGALWWPRKDMDYGCSGCGYIIQNGALKIYAGKTMSEWTDFNNIGQATTLYLKVGGKPLASAKINIKQNGPVNASMECKPAIVPLDGSTTCTVYFELKSADTVTLNLEEVDFGGKKVWPNGPSSVTVNKQTVILTPTNMQEDLTITLDINKEFVNYYLDYPLLNYGYKMTKYSYLIVAKISDGLRVSDVVQLSDPVNVQTFEDKARKAYGIAKTIKSAYDDAKSGIIGILETVTVKGGKELAWILHYHTLLEDQETPNNNIIGG